MTTPSPDQVALAADLRIIHIAAKAACKASGIAGGRLVLCAYGEDQDDGSALTARNLPFEIGDHASMADRTADWTMERGYNVYRGFSVANPGLRALRRGKAADVLGVFGVCADLDGDKGNRFDPDALPLLPTLLTRTAVAEFENELVPNFQATYLFAQCVPVGEARILGRALAAIVGDADGATADPIHVWRPAGSLNWPKKTKLARGRSIDPQLVLADPRGTGEIVTPKALRAALETALAPMLNGRSLDEEFGEKKAKVKKPERIPGTTALIAQSMDAPQVKPQRLYGDINRWDGNPIEIERIADALKFIDAAPYDKWRTVGMGLHHYGRDEQWAYDLWSTWSRGDVARGYTGASNYDEQGQLSAWASFNGNTPTGVKIGSVVRLAKLTGWESRRARFGLASRNQRPALLPESYRPVMEAADAMPRGALFHIAREAHLREFTLRTTKVRLVRLLTVLTAFINHEFGYAWAGDKRLAVRMSCTESCSIETVQKILRELVDAKAIVLVRGLHPHVNGLIGPIYALTPPQGWTWGQLVDWDRRDLGHDVDVFIATCDAETPVALDTPDHRQDWPNQRALPLHRSTPGLAVRVGMESGPTASAGGTHTTRRRSRKEGRGGDEEGADGDRAHQPAVGTGVTGRTHPQTTTLAMVADHLQKSDPDFVAKRDALSLKLAAITKSTVGGHHIDAVEQTMRNFGSARAELAIFDLERAQAEGRLKQTPVQALPRFAQHLAKRHSEAVAAGILTDRATAAVQAAKSVKSGKLFGWLWPDRSE